MTRERHLSRGFSGRITAAGLAVTAVLAVSAGAAWNVLAGTPPVAAPVARASAGAVPAAPAPTGERRSYADVVKAVAPAVATIRTEGSAGASTRVAPPDEDLFRRFFGDRVDPPFNTPQDRPQTFRRSGLGSGVIVSRDGYVLTNHHVIAGADRITAELTDGRSLPATLVGADEPSDLALLKVDAGDLHALPLGDSDQVEVGDVVLAVGNPLGVGQTVTMGIVSAKGRSTTGPGSGTYEDFLQTDAPINHGNSGGALVSVAGELVGINSQILSPSSGNIGIGFAIPSNMARYVMDQLRTHGQVTRAQLGVTVQPVTSDLAASLGLKQVGGAIVVSVSSGSAAERAGLQRGDVIESFNGEPVNDTNSLRNRVALAGPGSTAELTVVRDGGERRVSVRLDEAATNPLARWRDEAAGEGGQAALGLMVEPVTPEVAARLGAAADARGLVVRNVDPEGRAAGAGIQSGDIIEEVNRKPVRSPEDLRAAVNATRERPLLLLVNREGRNFFLTVPRA